jgi:Zn-dependent protease with chaperone function
VILVGGFALMSVLMFGPAGIWLERSAWPQRAPRAAIVLWQAIGVNGALAAIGAGLALAVEPLHRGLLAGMAELVGGATGRRVLPINGLYEACGLTLAAIVVAVLLAGLINTTVRTTAIRRRHRILLDLVSVASERVPGAVLLKDPRATAYCLPGVRPRIVVSDGTLDLLSHRELAAVVDHERGHVHEHHDLALLPFASMIEMLDWMPYVSKAPRAVAGLLEMAADDYASRTHDRHVLASALVSMADSSLVPACAFAAASSNLSTRVRRLIAPRSKSATHAALSIAAAAALVAAPLAAIAIG